MIEFIRNIIKVRLKGTDADGDTIDLKASDDGELEVRDIYQRAILSDILNELKMMRVMMADAFDASDITDEEME